MNSRFVSVCIIAGMVIACIPLVCAEEIIGGSIGGSQGNIRVQCNVDGASVSAGGYSCTISGGECTIVVYTTGTPVTDFSCSKSGYNPFYGTVPRMPAAGETVEVFCTLNPIPPPVQYGTIYAESSPSGAAVLLNGNYRGVSPLTISQVRTGSYSVEFDLSGYEPCARSTTVEAGLQSSVYCQLKPISSPGSLYIISSPSNAMIYLDGEYRGRTPITLSGISPGNHNIELDLSGYYDWKSWVSVPAGGIKTVSATMMPIPAGNTGWIHVTSSPAKATVYLDGAVAGQTAAADGVLRIDNVRAGDHNIRVEMAGYQPFATTVNVQVSTVSDVTAALVPATGPSGTGTMSVSSTPAGASVFVDNVLKGVTPLTLTDIPAGSHQIMLRLEGYKDYSSAVEVNAGATNTVTAALSTGTTPLPTKSAPVPLAVVGALALTGLLVIRRHTK
jgi:hypothetical protein